MTFHLLFSFPFSSYGVFHVWHRRNTCFDRLRAIRIKFAYNSFRSISRCSRSTWWRPRSHECTAFSSYRRHISNTFFNGENRIQNFSRKNWNYVIIKAKFLHRCIAHIHFGVCECLRVRKRKLPTTKHAIDHQQTKLKNISTQCLNWNWPATQSADWHLHLSDV